MATSTENAPPPILTNAGAAPAPASPTTGTSPTSLQITRSVSRHSQDAASKSTSTGTSDDAQPAVGSLLRLKPLTIHDLPTPPDWSKENSAKGPSANSAYWQGEKSQEHPTLVEFVERILLEGHRFIKDKSKFKDLGEATSKPSTAKVQKTHRVVSEAELRDVSWDESICTKRRGFKPKKEDWYGRRSAHETRLADGTASWLEFVDGLLYKHSENEAEYDPSVYDCRCIIDWKSHIEQYQNDFNGRFRDVSMRVMEMCHTIPVGQPRHFTTLVVSGRVHPVCFLTVQVPVDLSKDVPEAFYSSGRNVREGTTTQQRKKTVEGIYTSIEQCLHLPEKGEVQWEMTTASDAGGLLPLPVQKMAMPGQVAKDVGFFMSWVMKKSPRPIRSRSRQASRASNGSRRESSPRNGSLRNGSLRGSLRRSS